MSEIPNFAQRLSALLNDQGITQLELAERIGVTRAAMSRYVSGDREPRLVTVARIAQELGVPIEQLIASEEHLIEGAIRMVARHRLTDDQRARLNEVLNRGKSN